MPPGLLDFFVLEASECVEQLDGLLARSSAAAPDLEAFGRFARALRGSATMAKVQRIALVAAGVERVAKALRDGTVTWNHQLRGTLIAAVDDLKILIHGVRAWGPAEEQRAESRIAELLAVVPLQPARAATPPLSSAGSSTFLATEMAEVGDALVRYAVAPRQIVELADTLRRLRALRGVAALRDLPPLAEVVDSVDNAVKSLEMGGHSPSDAQRALLRAAGVVLAEGADAVRSLGRPDPASAAVAAFAAAAEKLAAGAEDSESVVPIASLFSDDGGAHVLHSSPNPPTTPEGRFRLEVVSQAEHLRRLVSDARAARDVPTRQRLGHELRGSVRALSRVAESFGESSVAMTLQALIEGASLLDPRALGSLEQASAILTAPGGEPVGPRFEALLGAAIAAPLATPAVASPAVTPAFAVAATPAPVAPASSGASLNQLLASSLAGLSKLDDEPLSEPAELEDDGVVPIQDLLYRGQAALRRAIELGGLMKKSGGAPEPASFAELLDLLELAAAE